jgi:hypothetical protein
MIIFLLIDISIISFIAGIHIYWALGGKWSLSVALPTNEKGEYVLSPEPVDSMVVGMVLIAFSVFHLIRADIVPISIPDWIEETGSWIIGGIFVLRALGDFTYVGYFKRVKDTPFGRLDSKFYSPLCLLIGILTLWVGMMI